MKSKKSKLLLINPLTKAVALLALSSGALASNVGATELKTKSNRGAYEKKEASLKTDVLASYFDVHNPPPVHALSQSVWVIQSHQFCRMRS